MSSFSQISKSTRKMIGATLVGNTLDHYDTALYGFLAPFFASVFFPNEDRIVALIYTYGLMSASLIARPLGALFFGRWGAQLGGRRSFIISLVGLSITTGCMGLVPGYDMIGRAAPLLVVLLRFGQGFFAAGETTIAPLLILNYINKEHHGRVSGLYGSTTVFGEMMASLAVTVISMTTHPEVWWRIPFIASFATGAIGLYIRSSIKEDIFKEITLSKLPVITTLVQNQGTLLRVILLSGLTYITYSIPFVFLNSFVPVVTTISITSMMMVNTALLLFDMVLAPIIGYFSDRFSPRKFMIWTTGCLMVTAVPLFALIPYTALITISLIRIWIVTLGLGINVPFKPWLMNQVQGPERYLLVGIGYSIGSEIFGRNAPAICLWLWHVTGWVCAPGLYIMAISFTGLIALAIKQKQHKAILSMQTS
jgi:MFS family permease